MMAMNATGKTGKKTKAKTVAPVKNKPVHALAPWSCVHHGDRSEIKAYVMAAGEMETVAKIDQTKSVDAEVTAEFIARAVNDHEKMQNVIGELVAALELCLVCPDLSWEANLEAGIAIAHAKQEGLVP
jgi:hypothetical protein